MRSQKGKVYQLNPFLWLPTNEWIDKCRNLWFFVLSCFAAYGILVPWPGIEPGPLAMAAQPLNHCAAREIQDLWEGGKKFDIEASQSCLPLWDPIVSSLPGSFIHGIFLARILEWVAISFSRRSSQPRDRTRVSHIVCRRFTVWATREVRIYKRTTGARRQRTWELFIHSQPALIVCLTVCVFFPVLTSRAVQPPPLKHFNSEKKKKYIYIYICLFVYLLKD